jgi:hypothetical protein
MGKVIRSTGQNKLVIQPTCPTCDFCNRRAILPVPGTQGGKVCSRHRHLLEFSAWAKNTTLATVYFDLVGI